MNKYSDRSKYSISPNSGRLRKRIRNEGKKGPEEYDKIRNRWIIIFTVIVFFVLSYLFYFMYSQTKNDHILVPQNSKTK